MRSAKIVSPEEIIDIENSMVHVRLDMRKVKLQHAELAQVIRDSVERTQRPIVRTLPDQLFVTQSQFASLQNFTEPMADTEDRMFLTPFNIMEVLVDREHVDDVEAVQETFDLLDALQEVPRDETLNEHEHQPNPGRQVPGQSPA